MSSNHSLNQMRQEFEDDFLGARAHEEAYTELMEVVGIKPSCVEVRQVGGNHYVSHKIQPWNIIDDWNLDYYLGNVVKYILREKTNKVEDLQKAIHYLEKKIELENAKSTTI